MAKKVNEMEYDLFPLSSGDREEVIDIFNYYVENSFAAYPERRVPYEFFGQVLQYTDGYPTVVAKNKSKTVLGFGMLRPYSPMPTIAGTVEITDFIEAEFTGKGIGSKMLEYLLGKAGEKGFHCILASISSLNEGSVRFHSQHGFSECGRFKGVGKKQGSLFDIVFMQKLL
jgi:L-amino acid N-acyltransferase YncA